MIVIGCDYDGTLTDLHKFYLVYGKKCFKKEVVNSSVYGLRGMFEVSKKEEIIFGLKYFISYCKDLSIRNNASMVLLNEQKEGAKIHAITARKYVTKNNIFGKYIRKLAVKYAKENNINFDSYEFCSEENTLVEKLAACKKLSVDIMIDDLPEVALYLAKNNIKVALIDTPYNKKVKHKNIFRCNNFLEVQKVIEDIKKSKNKEKDKFELLSKEDIGKLKKIELENYYTNYKISLLKEKIDKEKINIGKKRYKLLYPIINIFTLRFLLVKVKNKENLIYQDGLIVILNHLDSLDQFSVAYALNGKYLCGYASSTIKNTIRGKLANFTSSTIFVDRDNKSSRKKAKKEFDLRILNGDTSLVFPEGTRKNKYSKYDNKEILEFKLGAFSSSQITGSPILPIAIYKKKKNSKKSTLIVGKLMYVNKTDDLKTKAKEAEHIILKMIKDERKNNETINKTKTRS